MNTKCYHLKEYTYDDPIFKDVEATYIIHLVFHLIQRPIN